MKGIIPNERRTIMKDITKYKEEKAIQMLDQHLKEMKKEPEKCLLRAL